MFLIRVYPVIAVSRSRCQIKVLVDQADADRALADPGRHPLHRPVPDVTDREHPGRLVTSRTAPARASSALTVADRMPAAENL
jgi:hypothetical protein